MNYYNPYFYSMPSTFSPSKVGIFSRLFGGKGITFGSILSGTQKALGFANQAIPVVKQATPIIKNAKTMFKVMNEFKKNDKQPLNRKYNSTSSNKPQHKTEISNNTNIEVNENSTNNNGLPVFFA